MSAVQIATRLARMAGSAPYGAPLPRPPLSPLERVRANIAEELGLGPADVSDGFIRAVLRGLATPDRRMEEAGWAAFEERELLAMGVSVRAVWSAMLEAIQ